MNNPYSPPGAPVASPYAYAPPTASAAAVSEGTLWALTQTRPWVRLISVLSLVLAGLMLLGGFFMVVAGAVAGAAAGAQPFPIWALGLVYLPIAGLYVYPGVKLWMYANAISRVEAGRSTADLEAALVQQKSFWKYSGIMAIVAIVAYGLLIVGAMVVGVAGALGKS